MKPVLTMFVRVAAVLAMCGAGQSRAAVPEYGGTVVHKYPHDPKAFTEGLLYQDGYLYEGTGLNGQSSIRKVALETGQVVRRRDVDSRYFGEGIVIWDGRLIELTYKTGVGFVYDAATFDHRADFHYGGEGWGLTRDAAHIYMSDGTTRLRVLDPNTLNEINRIPVTCDGRPVGQINELEWVKGEIYANVWRTSLIVRIDPVTGHVAGIIDLSDLAALVASTDWIDVLNGIAYDAAGDRLFVTGKLWPSVFQIVLSPRTETKNLCQSLPDQ